MNRARLLSSWLARRAQSVHARRRTLTRRRKLLFEALEPRLLLSADPSPFTIDMVTVGNELSLSVTTVLDASTQQTTENLIVINSVTGEVVDEKPLDDVSEVQVRGTEGDEHRSR